MGDRYTMPPASLHHLHQSPNPDPISLVCHLIAPKPIGHQIDPKLDWSSLGSVVDLEDYHKGLHAIDAMSAGAYVDPANGFQAEHGGQS